MQTKATPARDRGKTIMLRPVDQARIAALRADTGIDNDVDVIRLCLADACKARGLDVVDPVLAAHKKEAGGDP